MNAPKIPKRIIMVNINRLSLCSKLAPKGINRNGIMKNKYLGPQLTNPCQPPLDTWKIKLKIKNEENKIQSDLFFLKKSGNEKNIVIRIGAKIKRPIPGANNNPAERTIISDILAGMIDAITPSWAEATLTLESEDCFTNKNGISFDIK